MEIPLPSHDKFRVIIKNPGPTKQQSRWHDELPAKLFRTEDNKFVEWKNIQQLEYQCSPSYSENLGL